MQNTLRESVIPVYQDQVYRRQGKHIIIAQVESIVPLHSTLDPNIWGGGTPELTWRRLQHFFGRSPLARHGQMPCHFYTEYLVDDYETFVGCPLSNKSWFLTEAVFQGVLPVVYSDAILVVLQENYSIESIVQNWANIVLILYWEEYRSLVLPYYVSGMAFLVH
jgi:hypothetical protein